MAGAFPSLLQYPATGSELFQLDFISEVLLVSSEKIICGIIVIRTLIDPVGTFSY